MQKISCPLVDVKQLTDDVFEYHYDFEDTPVEFQPGQFFMLSVPGGEKPVNRSYSVARPPSDKGFALCVKLIPEGLGSEYLRASKVGDQMDFMAPAGHFTLKDSNKEVIMVATGTGLAPFMSMLPIMFERGDQQPITLYFGVRHESDLFYVDQLKEWEEAHDNFTAVLCVSRAEDSWEGVHGRVTDALENHPIDAEDTKVYICGNGNMVKDVRAMMKDAGLTKEDLHFELFTPIV